MFVTQRRRLFSALKSTILALTHRTLQTRESLSTARLLPAASAIQLLNLHWKDIHKMSIRHASSVEHVYPMKFTERILNKIGILDIQKYRYMVLGYLVYEHVLAQVDYKFFFKYFNMPDTLFSWFLITELHVWMIMIRYMAEGKTGQLIRNNTVSAMWEDTNFRTQNLGKISNKLKNEQIKELSYQFNAAIIGYDEGIQSDDKVLAGALWRRFFHLECNNPEHIEIILVYIRKNIALFDNLPTENILKEPIFNLIDIKTLCKV